MIYHDFLGNQVSALGFGTMRLPLSEPGQPTKIDEEELSKMLDYAISHGVNYFDTAYPYHLGVSEIVIGRLLKKYPRESYYLVDKYPGHQYFDSYDPADIFEEQLSKCDVDYFDYYLLHNVYENDIDTYNDPKWGIVDYFVKQKELGRIKHLGFSSHGRADLLEEFVDRYQGKLEFCQIQLNYLDWTLQEGKEKYEILTSRNIPIVVMEPLRGGKLANLPEESHAILQNLRPGLSDAGFGLTYLQGLENVHVTLSGMSNLEQMIDNIHTFENLKLLSKKETDTLYEIAETLKNSVPCTACRYCCEGCPLGLNIPVLINAYNDLIFQPTTTPTMLVDSLPEDKKPSACIGCGACASICPQKIDIPAIMTDLTERLKTAPNWKKICEERARAAAALRLQK